MPYNITKNRNMSTTGVVCPCCGSTNVDFCPKSNKFKCLDCGCQWLKGMNKNGAYQDFFKKKLADYGVSSPAELKDEAEKKKFFSEIELQWTDEKSE